MSDADGMPRIQIDDDWKQEAQREKERLAAKAKASPAGPAASASPQAGGRSVGRAARELPPAGFETLVSTLASQAIMYMGGYTDPRTGQPMISLDTARYQIDLLGVLEEKTKNNLSEAEQATLASTLYELRMRYVELVHAVRDAARGREPSDTLT